MAADETPDKQDREPSGPSESSESSKPSQKQSLPARIATSATELSKAFVSGSGSGDSAATLASGAGLTQKGTGGESSSSSTAASAFWSERTPLRPNTGNGSVGFRSTVPGRSNNADQLEREQFESFTHATASLSTNDDRASSANALEWQAEFKASPMQLQPESKTDQKHDPFLRLERIHLQSEQDGKDVQLLLSDPAFSPDTDASMPGIDEPTDQTVQDLFGDIANENERSYADRIKSELPPPPTYRSRTQEDELSQLLGFGSDMDEAFSPEERRMWSTAMENYTEEVWGDLQPEFEALVEQMKESRLREGRPDSTAVARLKMILGHLATNSTAMRSGGGQNGSNDLASASSNQAEASQRDQSELTSSAVRTQNIHGYSSERHRLFPAEQGGFLARQASGKDFQGHSTPTNHAQNHLPYVTRQSTGEQPAVTARVEFEQTSGKVSRFQCPHGNCHNEFSSMAELERHSMLHFPFVCPHLDCKKTFTSRDNWAGHIMSPHLDLVE